MTALPHRPIAGMLQRTVNSESIRLRREAEQARLDAQRQRDRAERALERAAAARATAARIRAQLDDERQASRAAEMALNATIKERDRLRARIQPQPLPASEAHIAIIIGTVCGYCQVEPDAIADRTRRAKVVLARELVVTMLRRYTKCSYPDIARAMGRPNHSSVITMHQRLDRHVAGGVMADPRIPMLSDLTLEQVLGDVDKCVRRSLRERPTDPDAALRQEQPWMR